MKRLTKRLAGVAVVAMLTLSMSVPAMATVTESGTRGEANCYGIYHAWFAQSAGPNGVLSPLFYPGISNIAFALDWSVKELKEYARGACD